MNEPKLHHFLPKHCYLEAFKADTSTDEKSLIWVYEKDRPARLQNINTTAAVGKLYTFYDEDGKQDQGLERSLAKVEDSLASTDDKCAPYEISA